MSKLTRAAGFLLVFTFICTVLTVAFPCISVTSATETVNAKTYFYDKIYDDARVWYDRIKLCYDNKSASGNMVIFEQAMTLTEEEYRQLTLDVIVGEAALFADDPTYRYKGRVDQCAFSADFGTEGQFSVTVQKGSFLPESHITMVEARIDQIVETVGQGDRYTKLHKLAQYLIDNTFYDPYLDAINDGGKFTLATRGFHYNTTIVGLMLENIAICEGFSQSVKVLCDRLDVPCIIMGNQGHAWNLVQMEDGGWYRLDITNACRVGWDGIAPENYFETVFLNNDVMGSYADPYMISVDDDYRVTDFPEYAPGKYNYTGNTTDFTYTEAENKYKPQGETFHYRINEDQKTCTVTLYEGVETGDLTIPEAIDGYTVTGIDPYAFYYCTGFDGKLTVPDTVTFIGAAAFAGCCNLTSVSLPKSLQSIGDGAFIGCKNLTEVQLPDLVDFIDEFAFYDCDRLASVSFGGHVQSIDPVAFDQIQADLTFTSPANSVPEAYAKQKEFAHTVQGTACALTPTGSDYRIDGDYHYTFCEHGARVNFATHTVADGTPDCGDCCEACGSQYCADNGGFGENIFIYENKSPANCVEAEFTGDLKCPCGAYFVPGEHVGEPSPEHVADEQFPWESDETSHYKWCVCAEEKVQVEAHRSAESDGVCDVCGVEYKEQTSGITGVIIGGGVVVVLGIGIVIFLVLKKKKA